jgi:hypothetical protein
MANGPEVIALLGRHLGEPIFNLFDASTTARLN